MKLIALVLAPALTLAQTTFEVASIKPSTPASIRNSDGGPGSSNPTRYTYHQATLLDLIATAYNVDYFQVASKLPISMASPLTLMPNSHPAPAKNNSASCSRISSPSVFI